MPDGVPEKFVRNVFALLFGTGIITSVGIFGVLFLLTHRIDQQASAETRGKLVLVLKEWQNSLKLAVEDYSYWTVAYDGIVSGDTASIYENLGSGATESDLFDWIVILSSEGAVLHEYAFPDAINADDFFGGENGDAIFEELRASRPQDYVSTSGYFRLQDHYSLASIAWVTPDDMSEIDVANLPVLVGGRNIDAQTLEWLQMITGAERLEVLSVDTGAVEEAIALNGPMGTVGHLSVGPKLSGTVIRNEVIPWVALVCISIALISYSLARHFRHMALKLKKAILIASTDQLTGIANRAALHTYLEDPKMDQALLTGRIALLNIDLNMFKELNDTRGHRAGDLALKVTAQRLSRAVRRGDLVARFGGDEFLCVINDADPKTTAIEVADRIAELFEKSIDFGDFKAKVHLSIGIAIGQKDDTWDALLDRSDTAMYSAKKHGVFKHVMLHAGAEPVGVA